jgi:hypothetical protein
VSSNAAAFAADLAPVLDDIRAARPSHRLIESRGWGNGDWFAFV